MNIHYFNNKTRVWYLLIFLSFTVAKGEEQFHLESKYLNDDGRTIEAQGNVKVKNNFYNFCASELYYDKETGIIRAEDSFELNRLDNSIKGSRGIYDVFQKKGFIEDFEIDFAESDLRAGGKQVDFEHSMLSGKNIVVTSCPTEKEYWRISTESFETNLETKMITAENARFEFLGIPIFYFPFINFYYGKERRSGFLYPEGNFGSGSGFELGVPYYFNLANNYDWTLTPKIHSKNGFQLQNEFRYKTLHSDALFEWDAELFDAEDNRFRQKLDYQYAHLPWKLQLQLEKVSNDSYFRDFGEGTEDKAKRNLPRRITWEYIDENWLASLKFERFQSLDSNLRSPHSVLPMLSLLHFKNSDDFDWGNEFQIARFEHSDNVETEATRYLWKFNGEKIYHFDYLTVNPVAKLHAVGYSGNAPGFVVPHFQLNAESRLNFPQLGKNNHLRYRSALVYIPKQKQSKSPVFDTALKQSSLDNLYDGNRFSGEDRVGDAKWLVYGIEYRSYENNDDNFFLGAGQRYYFEESSVRLTNDVLEEQGFGNVFLEGRFRFNKDWKVGLNAEWDPQSNFIERFYTNLEGKISKQTKFQISYLNDKEEDISLGIASTIFETIDIALSTDYALDQDRFTHSQLLLRIRSQCDCFRINLKVEDSVVKNGDNDIELSVGFDFVGLATIGSQYTDNFDF